MDIGQIRYIKTEKIVQYFEYFKNSSLMSVDYVEKHKSSFGWP